jgi:membrane fusion protein (multidrug efflux system)
MEIRSNRLKAILLSCTIGSMLGLSSCSDEPVLAPALEVVVAPARQDYFPIYGEYIATTHASLDVEVRARVDGFLQEHTFTEGGRIQEGDPLYRIDNRPYVARVKRLKAQLESAEAALAKSKRDVVRLKPLYEQDAASQLDLDNAESARDQASASVSAAQAELTEAELELEYTEVRAPISGLAGESRVDIGALVGSNGESLLTTIKQTDPMFIEFHMSALDYLNARRSKDSWSARQKADESGKSVEGYVRITLPDDSEYRFWGDISFTDPQVNSQTGTFSVRAVVPNPDRELLPGQYTRATLELDAIANAVIIDEKTIQIEQGGSYVMVAMPDNTVERRFIVLGHRHNGEVTVSSGLEAGEQVIVEGMHKVQHGQSIAPLTVEEYQIRLEAEEAARKEATAMTKESTATEG